MKYCVFEVSALHVFTLRLLNNHPAEPYCTKKIQPQTFSLCPGPEIEGFSFQSFCYCCKIVSVETVKLLLINDTVDVLRYVRRTSGKTVYCHCFKIPWLVMQSIFPQDVGDGLIQLMPLLHSGSTLLTLLICLCDFSIALSLSVIPLFPHHSVMKSG